MKKNITKRLKDTEEHIDKEVYFIGGIAYGLIFGLMSSLFILLADKLFFSKISDSILKFFFAISVIFILFLFWKFYKSLNFFDKHKKRIVLLKDLQENPKKHLSEEEFKIYNEMFEEVIKEKLKK